ncbi:MAG: hypothetical protein QNJ41_02330 [Xenococcaceae cyanobacterium MO_188.B32]|nr:hypothetical protein [Xenococcaceae cyanobacterium MO_188.B32]
MITLREKLEEIQLDRPQNIPWIVKLLKSPRSLLALPGNISSENYDCICVLLNRNKTREDRAFVAGFCMGNDPKTTLVHIGIFNFFSRHLYPRDYRLNQSDFFFFDLGFAYGKSLSIQLNLIDFSKYKDISLSILRREFGIKIDDLHGIADYETEYQQKSFPFYSQYVAKNQSLKRKEKKIFYITTLKISSSVCGLLGGTTLALNTPISGYGFIFLACSSSQMLIASILDRDKLLMCYSATIFFCVDLLGIYRWIFN